MPQASPAARIRPQAVPVTQPATPRPTVRDRTTSRSTCVVRPSVGPGRSVVGTISPRSSDAYMWVTLRWSSRFGLWRNTHGPQCPRLLDRLARGGPDPSGGGARSRPGRGAGADRVLRCQPGHGDAGVPGSGAGQPVRRDAGPLSGGRLPGAGEVRLPQRGNGTGWPAGVVGADRVLPVPTPDHVRGTGQRGGAGTGRCPSP